MKEFKEQAVERIEVYNRYVDLSSHPVVINAQRFLDLPIVGAESYNTYLIKTETLNPFPDSEINLYAKEVLSDSIIQGYILQDDKKYLVERPSMRPSFIVDVSFRPGVTDNIGNSATEALSLISDFARENKARVYSGTITLLYGDIFYIEADRVARELLFNELIQDVQIYTFLEFRSGKRFFNQKVPAVSLKPNDSSPSISLYQNDSQLLKMNEDNFWALNLEELHTIRDYFDKTDVKRNRILEGLREDPTDVEMAILAQTWSEHCKHKIFSSDISYEEELDSDSYYPSIGKMEINSLYKSYIQKTTKEVKENRNLNSLISVFSDNAGIVRFDESIDLCIKVETHNTPSALDPYGGALTGIVGVNRDILGCGLSARPIANTDVFCFAPLSLFEGRKRKTLPQGLKHPRRILEGVHLGVEHGGNKSGIPTVNGSIVFHKSFVGKPLVFCGTIGVMPQQLKDGTPTYIKGQKVGDYIVMAGGKIGKDGIYGATFSSMSLQDKGVPATAVQIGDPITQKRLSDFIFAARDRSLFSSITDNGAGGLSSSVGEMAVLSNGATIQLEKAPLKYNGLSPMEIVISESQERMTFSVSPEKLEEFLLLAKDYGVEANEIGTFTDDGFFRVKYKGKTVSLISMNFLHKGLPKMRLHASWNPSKEMKDSFEIEENKEKIRAQGMDRRYFYEEALHKLLSNWNICSKESLVRRYDHEVQAATLIKPFVGVKGEGPSDAALIWLGPHGGDPKTGISVACGIAPKYSNFDAYIMAQHALDEAVRNCVAIGGDPDNIVLVDNFCWPDPIPSSKNKDSNYKLGQLVRACHALKELAVIYGTPFVSGKDSMKNEYIGKSRFGKEIKISALPTVLITAMGKVPDVSKTVTSEFKNKGDKIFLLGKSQKALGESEITACYDFERDSYMNLPPKVDAMKNIKLYRLLFQAINKSLIKSCHDCSDGGMVISLAESIIGSEKGVSIELMNTAKDRSKDNISIFEYLFNESPGRFIITVDEKNEDALLSHFGSSCTFLGTVTDKKSMQIQDTGLVIMDVPFDRIRESWKKTL